MIYDSRVLDVILQWSETMMSDRHDAANVVDGVLLVAIRHDTRRLVLSLPVRFSGEPNPPSWWVLRKIAPGVWKPISGLNGGSSVHEAGLIHTFITVVGVPEPAPWE